jgi:tetratricopeptide (TPR) repeat protein
MHPATRKIWLGRAREMGELDAAVDELLHGRGSVFLFVGEPGIGKTRLADEVGRSAATRGASVHWGRAWEAGGAPSYWPFVQLLRSVLRGVDGEAFVASLGLHGRELSALIPELQSRDSGQPQDIESSPRDRFLLFDAVGAFLQAAAARGPLVLILDDLHAADPSSLLLLQFLVRDAPRGAVLIIGTYRDAEARMSRETSAALTQIAREANVLPLRRLDRAEVAEYLAAVSGSSPTPLRIDAVHKQTEGNPLFLRELLRLDATAGRQPEGIREVIRARLALLPPAVREALETASVLGREFELATLAQMTESTETALTALLVPAFDASILERLEGATHVRFTHLLLREGLYAELPVERRTKLHAAAATALSESSDRLPIAERAHHLLLAIPSVPVGDAADAVLRAAERSMDVMAFEDASDLLGRAATLLEGAPNEEERLFEVLLALGLARIRSADVANGKRVCLRAADLAKKLHNGEHFARAVLGCTYEFAPGVRNPQLIALLEDALAMLPPEDGALRARCMAQLAAERQPEPDTRGPMALARGAVAMARRLGEKETLRFTLSAAALALMVYADPEERTALNQETLRLAQAAHDKRLALRAHLLLANDYWEQGALDRVELHVRAYESVAAEFSHGAFHWTFVGLRAGLALGKGEFETAERDFRRTAELAQKDATRGTSMAAVPTGLACAEERYDKLAEVEFRTREAFGSVTHDLGGCIAELLIARLHARARARDEAAKRLDAVRAHPVFPQIREPAWLTLLAEVCHLVGDAALATSLYAALEPCAERLYNLGHLGPCCEPPYSRQLGLLAQTMGRHDAAIRHLMHAEAKTAALGMKAHLARLRLELAEAHLARGAATDLIRAQELLVDARNLALALGQSALVRFVDERAPASKNGPGPSVPAAPPTSNVALLREGDFWTVSCGARTVRLRDSRGMGVLDQLLASPGQEFHVLQLISPSDDGAASGDAGTLLDSEAIHSYRKRLLDLREELEEAEAFSDQGRTNRAKGEIEFLTQELARAVGLGGRERRAGNAAERARTTVQKRLREAIRRIEDELPEVGAHLEHTIRTGTFCGYFPHGRPRQRS